MKVTLNINGNHFDINVDDTFHGYLLQEMAKDLNVKGNNDSKSLLQAYIRKNFELYKLEKRLSQLVTKLETKR